MQTFSSRPPSTVLSLGTTTCWMSIPSIPGCSFSRISTSFCGVCLHAKKHRNTMKLRVYLGVLDDCSRVSRSCQTVP